MSAAQTSPPKKSKEKSVPSNEKKCLMFAAGTETFALELTRIREIIGYIDITPIPNPPPHVKGVVRMRGQTINVVDLRSRLELPITETTDDTCILVVERNEGGNRGSTGILVDRVMSVQPMSAEVQNQLLDVEGLFGSEYVEPPMQSMQLPRAA